MIDGNISIPRHPTLFTLVFRKQIEVCTDPQRRCYHGVYAKSEMGWTEWGEVYHPQTLEDGQDSVLTFQAINPTRQYALLPPTNHEGLA